MNVGCGVGEGSSVGLGVSVDPVLASTADSSFDVSTAVGTGVIVGGISTREKAGSSGGSAVAGTILFTIGLVKVAVGSGATVAGKVAAPGNLVVDTISALAAGSQAVIEISSASRISASSPKRVF